MCAHKYMACNLLLIKVLHIFDISNTRCLLGLAQKHICNIIEEIVFRNCTFFTFYKNNFFNYVSNMLPSKSWSRLDLVKIQCSKYQKLFKTLIRNIFQDMYCRAHKTAILTPIQHTVPPPDPPLSTPLIGVRKACSSSVLQKSF